MKDIATAAVPSPPKVPGRVTGAIQLEKEAFELVDLKPKLADLLGQGVNVVVVATSSGRV